jgi:hypothetical protein
MSNIDFITPFLEKLHNRNSLIDGLSRLSITDNISITTIPFGTEESPPYIFSLFSKNKRKVNQIYYNEGVYLFKLDYQIKDGGDLREENGFFFVYECEQFKNVYLAITIESHFFIKKGLYPFIKSIYPKLYLTFIKHDKLSRLLHAFKARFDNLNLVITRASLKNRYAEKELNSRLVPMVGWPNLELDEALKWAAQNDSWFQSLQLKLNAKNTIIAEISLNRQGIVSTNHLYDEVMRFFILPTCQILEDNMKMFTHRSRRDNNSLSVRPIAIDFGYERFKETEENKKFIDVMRGYNKAAISVLHGNPYLHLTVIDYFDGSNFDLWMVSPDIIAIVPQMKGSIAAIKRLVNHIFDTFAEGKIIDYSEAIN